MPYIKWKYLTKSQKRYAIKHKKKKRVKGWNVPWKYLTKSQKSHMSKNKRYGKY